MEGGEIMVGTSLCCFFLCQMFLPLPPNVILDLWAMGPSSPLKAKGSQCLRHMNLCYWGCPPGYLVSCLAGVCCAHGMVTVSHILLYLWQFLILSRWGTRYNYSNEEVCLSLLNFAIQKLLCGNLANKTLTKSQAYAMLLQQLALNINTLQYLFNLSSPLNTMWTMHDQIANHMCVCLAVRSKIKSLHSITLSEPILSEVASIIMSSSKTSSTLISPLFHGAAVQLL